MATNDDLDDFFKKKDRKANKHKKQSGLLTNNQELLKQLEIVTIATSAFKENLDLDEEDDEFQLNDESIVNNSIYGEARKNPTKSNKTKIPDNTKISHEPETINSVKEEQQQDEWEDFEPSSDKYEKLRLKFAAGNNDDNDEYFDDDKNNPSNNERNSDAVGDSKQPNDKSVWNVGQMKRDTETNASTVVEKPQAEQQPTPPKPVASTGAYRPPALRAGSSVIVVSGNIPPVSKKKEPNLASTDEFPTLRSTVNKK